MENMLTVKDVMENLHITSHTTMSKLLKIDGFPYIKLGKQYLIPENAYNHWVKTKMNTQIFL